MQNHGPDRRLLAPLMTSAFTPEWLDDHFRYSVEQMLAAGAVIVKKETAGDEYITYRNAIVESFALNLHSTACHLEDSGIELTNPIREAMRRYRQDIATLSVFRGSWVDKAWRPKPLMDDLLPLVLFYSRKEAASGRMSDKTLKALERDVLAWEECVRGQPAIRQE